MDHSFTKGLRIIEELATSDEPVGLTELAQRCSMVKSNVHKFLQILIAQRYVRQNRERGPYELTLKLWELGTRVMARLSLTAIARDPMRKLCTETGETVSIAVLDGSDVVYIDKVDGTHDVRAHTAVGRRRPSFCVSAGKALLAFRPDDDIERACARLKRYTALTIADPTSLRSQLEEIRRQGYAVNRGEWTSSVRGIAAPIRDGSGNVVAAVGISTPADRLSTAAERTLAPRVLACAKAISHGMGFAGDTRAEFAVPAPGKFAARSRARRRRR